MEAGDVRQERGIALRGGLAGERVVGVMGLEGAVEVEREGLFGHDGDVVVPVRERAERFIASGPGVQQARGVGDAPLLRRSATASENPFVLLEVAEDDRGDTRLFGESSGAEPGAWCEQQAVNDLGSGAPKKALHAAGDGARRGPVDMDVDGLGAHEKAPAGIVVGSSLVAEQILCGGRDGVGDEHGDGTGAIGGKCIHPPDDLAGVPGIDVRAGEQ